MAQMDEPDEVLDLVDEHDQKIGTIVREEVMQLVAGRHGFVRAANAFVVNNAGELWVPRRQLHKKIAPGGLDFSAGEHVQAGETYEQAVARGLMEELSLKVTPDQLEYIGALKPSRADVPYFEAIFITRYDVVPRFNQDDFTSGEWIIPEVLCDRLSAGEAAKMGLLPAVELLLAYNKQVKE
jgi:isopentenyldiphosphate isomerase